jgi:hypothetical protein
MLRTTNAKTHTSIMALHEIGAIINKQYSVVEREYLVFNIKSLESVRDSGSGVLHV